MDEPLLTWTGQCHQLFSGDRLQATIQCRRAISGAVCQSQPGWPVLHHRLEERPGEAHALHPSALQQREPRGPSQLEPPWLERRVVLGHADDAFGRYGALQEGPVLHLEDPRGGQVLPDVQGAANGPQLEQDDVPRSQRIRALRVDLREHEDRQAPEAPGRGGQRRRPRRDGRVGWPGRRVWMGLPRRRSLGVGNLVAEHARDREYGRAPRCRDPPGGFRRAQHRPDLVLLPHGHRPHGGRESVHLGLRILRVVRPRKQRQLREAHDGEGAGGVPGHPGWERRRLHLRPDGGGQALHDG
mmetsp:Transcript_8799/g.21664  ORF Transcript_8799/g.21664 Transcript_8799/m.21664 type:complete len:299 (-) Transcript_8799:5002-5898(-)